MKNSNGNKEALFALCLFILASSVDGLLLMIGM